MSEKEFVQRLVVQKARLILFRSRLQLVDQFVQHARIDEEIVFRLERVRDVRAQFPEPTVGVQFFQCGRIVVDGQIEQVLFMFSFLRHI